MPATRIERSVGPAIAGNGPARVASLAYINERLASGDFIPPITLSWMALGATLSASIDPELEFIIDGDLVPGRENTFILRNSATGNGDFDIPDDMFAMVTDNKTGKPMGSLRAISEFGRWIVGVAHYSKAQRLTPKSTQGSGAL